MKLKSIFGTVFIFFVLWTVGKESIWTYELLTIIVPLTWVFLMIPDLVNFLTELDDWAKKRKKEGYSGVQ